MPGETDSSSLLDLLRLNLVPGIGPRMQHALLDHFGSPGHVLRASETQLRQVGRIGVKLARAIRDHARSEDARLELERCREHGIDLIARTADGYPASLVTIHDAPPLLYCRGRLEPRDSLAIAIVGSRRCSLYGRQTAERLASSLARTGMTIVSGLARGIDAAAHRGALEANGRTIAVMGTGVLKIYPSEHSELATSIASSGAIVSEFPLDQRPAAGVFPQRNRIVSGLSLGVIIVEATQQSGALHTMEQGREVFAVPGRLDSLTSSGCHALIRDGATLIRNADDVLESLGPLARPVRRSEADEVHSPRELSLNDQERKVLNLVSGDPRSIDEVLSDAEIDSSRVLSTLTVLEMKRMVRRLPGGMLVRATY